MEPKRAKVLTPAKFRHLLRVTEATSRFPARDALILLLGITRGMRVTEITRLEVHHVLTKSGIRREEIALPGSITKGCRARCIFLAHPRAVEAFDWYVEWRYRRGSGASLDPSRAGEFDQLRITADLTQPLYYFARKRLTCARARSSAS